MKLSDPNFTGAPNKYYDFLKEQDQDNWIVPNHDMISAKKQFEV